jgi:hypothetical protein
MALVWGLAASAAGQQSTETGPQGANGSDPSDGDGDSAPKGEPAAEEQEAEDSTGSEGGDGEPQGGDGPAPAEDDGPASAEAGQDSAAAQQTEGDSGDGDDPAPDQDTEASSETKESEDEEQGSAAESSAPAEDDPVPAPGEVAREATRGEGPPEDDSDETDGYRPMADIPLEIDLHGFYRTRVSWIGNIPTGGMVNRQDAKDASFFVQRLRLNPTVRYGSDEDSPVAALKMQVDGFDNVVFGDNARIARTPLFAEEPSLTNVNGFDWNSSLRLNRVWLEFQVPVGQIRIGRMPSHWGMGILANDGNGLGEWGDQDQGTTFDRVMFATRPLTIYNALAHGDRSKTPLIFAFLYDKLVEDPVTGLDPPAIGDPSGPGDRYTVGPVSGKFEARADTPPLEFLADNEDDVNEAIGVLLWNDPNLNLNRMSDELTAGYYFIYRWQNSTDSDVYINDLFWRFRTGLGDGLPSFVTEGEAVHIGGTSRAISLAGGCGEQVCDKSEANIWGAVGSVGLTGEQERWSTELELGWSSGDGRLIGNDNLTVRALHPDYRVGLLMYQVAIAAQTANNLGEELRPLWSRGGVWNAKHIWPQVRYTIIPGLELHGAFLLAWADELNRTVYANERSDGSTSCGFEGDCFLGWEADLAVRVKWGENDLMHWDTEAGVMQAGDALAGSELGLSEEWLWTVQSRIAMTF